MAFGKANKVAVTCDASGDATVYLPGSEGSYTGPVLAIAYVKTNFDNAVDFTITAEATSDSPAKDLWVESNVTASKRVCPSTPTHDTVGVVGAASDYIWLVNQRIKIVVASGGNATTGTFYCEIG